MKKSPFEYVFSDMKSLRLAIILLIGVSGFVLADEDAQELKQYPYEANFFWDGGTYFIVERNASTTETAYCFDFRIESTTSGEFYAGGRHPGAEGAKMLSPTEASKVFAEIESKLQRYHGRKDFGVIQKEIPGIVTGQLESKADSKEKLDTQYILGRIEIYRMNHSAEQDGADQPATAVESKAEGEEKPKPESEVRPQ